jgi:predicted alpha/beta-hydrolase family hydrolase
VTEFIQQDGIHGFLHAPLAEANQTGVVLTHGAGADCTAPLLIAIAEQLAQHGFHVLRCNLAFRQRRRTGPPHPSKSEEDRYSLVQAAAFLRQHTPNRIILSGHSYGGRQATIAASENRTLADHLLLFSYPLHPPEKPEQLRTAHFPKLKIPATFIHGAKDPFGTPLEMQAALSLIPAATKLAIVEGAGHELKKGRFHLFTLAPELGRPRHRLF